MSRGPGIGGPARLRVGAARRRLSARMPVALVLALGLLLGGAFAAGWPGGPARVAASCEGSPDFDVAVLQGEVVFVGTVIRTENDLRWALVRIEERWQGADDLPLEVWVRGGPEGGSSTAIDRAFSPTRYLFVGRRAGNDITDDICSATTAWTPDLARLRPANVSPAPDVESNRAPSYVDIARLLPIVALFAALAIAVVSYVLILRARRRPPDWLR